MWGAENRHEPRTRRPELVPSAAGLLCGPRARAPWRGRPGERRPRSQLGQASGDELYIDPGAVSAAPDLLFYYEVYARDCMGSSVFD